MSDFTGESWGLFIAVITVASIIACAVLYGMTKAVKEMISAMGAR